MENKTKIQKTIEAIVTSNRGYKASCPTNANIDKPEIAVQHFLLYAELRDGKELHDDQISHMYLIEDFSDEYRQPIKNARDYDRALKGVENHRDLQWIST